MPSGHLARYRHNKADKSDRFMRSSHQQPKVIVDNTNFYIHEEDSQDKELTGLHRKLKSIPRYESEEHIKAQTQGKDQIK